MIENAPAILVVGPLLAACLIAAAGWTRRELCFPLALASTALSLTSALTIATRVVQNGVVEYNLGGWPPPIGIAYRVDSLSALVLVVVSGAALTNLIASRRSIEIEQGYKAPVFYAIYVLAMAGLLGIVVTGDAFNLYVLLEITSLSGYSLTAMGDERAPLATLRYLFIGTIGASFYLLGVGFLYAATGTLNMMDLAHKLPPLYGSGTVIAAFILIMVGLWIKAALFPLHGWLPGVYTYANSAASSLLAPLMTKVMIYVMIRMMLTVFTPDFVFGRMHLSGFATTLASTAIIMGATLALAQRDLKKMLTYIIVAEVGYMIGGAWLGTPDGMIGAVLHILNDALMTLCVFMAAANIIYKKRSRNFTDLKGLFAEMPFTMGALVLVALSIIGVPPTCGFFSKWYLLLAAYRSGAYLFMGALIFSSLVCVILFFRVFEIAYFEPFNDHGHGHGAPASHTDRSVLAEAPPDMVAPLMIMAAGLVAVGLFTGGIVDIFIRPAAAAAFF